MSNFINLKNRVLNQPLLLEPSYAQIFFGALSDKLGIQTLITECEKLDNDDMKESIDLFRANNPDRSQAKPYTVIKGTAIIPVIGSLVAKTGRARPYSGMTGYDGIKFNLDTAFADDDVTSIVLEMDSGGGEVTGCFELADFIFANRETKHMTALVQGMACSACYAIASACNQIAMSENATVGSVGVITAHVNYEKRLESDGIEVTLITAGKHKADGNPYESLSDDVLGRIQERLHVIRTAFATRVAKYRGITVDAVFKTEALTYLGRTAIDKLLADEIVSPIDFIENLSHTSGTNINLENNMPDENQDHEKALAAATVTGVKTGATEMQARIKGILGSEEAKGRTGLAEHMAYDTDMTIDAAVSMLKLSPKEQAEAPAPIEKPAATPAADFNEAMKANAAEEVGIEAEDDATVTAESDPVKFALNASKQING